MRPLAGRRVVVTRAEHQAGDLAAALAEAGAQVAFLPLIEVVPPSDPAPLEAAGRELSRFAWAAFTSANAVDALAAVAPPPWPAGLRLAAVGDATAEALRARGAEPDLIARKARGEGLAEELVPLLRPGAAILLPQAADARPELAAALRDGGVAPTVVVAYEKRRPAAAPARFAALAAENDAWGWVTFTSPSTVAGFVELAGEAWERVRPTLLAASIGPTTSRALRARGLEPAAEATEPSVAGLVAAIAERVAASAG